MNIDRNEANRHVPGNQFRREELYRTIPRWRELIAAVRAGEAEFVDTLAGTGLLREVRQGDEHGPRL